MAIAVTSLGASGRLAARYGVEWVLVGGLVLFVAGMLLLSRTPVDGSYLVDVAPALALMGSGFGLAMPQVTVLAMQDAPAELAGSASGVVNTTQQVGGTIGIGVVSTVAAAVAAGELRDGAPELSALAHGLGSGFTVAAGVLAFGTVLAVSLTRIGQVRTAGSHRESDAPARDRSAADRSG